MSLKFRWTPRRKCLLERMNNTPAGSQREGGWRCCGSGLEQALGARATVIWKEAEGPGWPHGEPPQEQYKEQTGRTRGSARGRLSSAAAEPKGDGAASRPEKKPGEERRGEDTAPAASGLTPRAGQGLRPGSWGWSEGYKAAGLSWLGLRRPARHPLVSERAPWRWANRLIR